MKKLLSIVMCLCLILSTFTFVGITASAYTEDYYTYTVTNNQVTITDCSLSISGDITIPSTLGGYPVKSIGDWAFEYCSSLTNVTIPDSVTSIGGGAFYGCESLKSVTIANSVTSIGSDAFEDCSSLTSVTIPDSVTSIGDDAFYGCESLTSVAIPKSVKTIGDDAFYECESLKSVNITDIKAWCEIDFYVNNYYDDYDVSSNPLSYAGNLYLNGNLVKKLTIPSTVTSIGAYAFYGCSSITSVTIPKSVKTIGHRAFCGCYSLTGVNIKDIKAWCEIEFDGEYSNPLYHAGKLYLNGNLVKSLTISSGVTSISDYAFYDCDSLKKITIPKSVKSIGEDAFCGCDSLTGVNIKDIKAWCEIEFDGEYSNPLYYAKNLYLNGNLVKKLTIPSNVTKIGYYAFRNCDSLKSVTIGNKVTSIGYRAFEFCSYLTSIKIPNSVKTIDDYAFSGCTLLKSVTIGNKVTSIGDYAFYFCGGLNQTLTSITIPKSVKSIGNYAFDECNLTSVTIPDTLTTVGEYAFCYDSVKELKIFEGSKKITSLMYSFKNIDKLVIPSTIKTIEADAFYNYLNLKAVYIPSTVTKIGKHAFGYYDNEDTFADYDLIKGFTICGKNGSAAHTYAKNNGIKFNAHKYKWVTTKKATYFAKGTSSYKCTACGKVAKTKSIAKLVLKKPTFKLTGAKGKFTVKYTKVTGATGFEVRYKLGSGKYKTVKVNTKKSISKVISKLKKGKYTVQVRAFVKSGSKTAYSSWASAKKVTVK